jgi:hypothetical protein
MVSADRLLWMPAVLLCIHAAIGGRQLLFEKHDCLLMQVDVDLLAGKREEKTEGGRRGLLDNYDDVEGYYNFQVGHHEHSCKRNPWLPLDEHESSQLDRLQVRKRRGSMLMMLRWGAAQRDRAAEGRGRVSAEGEGFVRRWRVLS